MNPATFDTYPYIKNLETKGGFNEAQAESILEAINGAQNALFSTVATKADIAQLTASVAQLANGLSQLATKAELADLRAATKAELADLRAATKAEFADLRTELAKTETKIADAKSELKGWMFTGFIAIAGLMATLHFIH